MKRRVAFLLALAAVLGAGACGGEGDRLSKEEYSDRVAATGDTLEKSFENVATEAGALGTGDISSVGDIDELMAELGGVVRGGVDSLNDAADDLEGVDPPEEVEAAHGKLVEGLRLLAGDFEEFAEAVEAGEFEKVEDLAAGFDDLGSSEAGRLLQEATDELEEKGYDLQGGL